jgi:hypothetical protein
LKVAFGFAEPGAVLTASTTAPAAITTRIAASASFFLVMCSSLLTRELPGGERNLTDLPACS